MLEGQILPFICILRYSIQKPMFRILYSTLLTHQEHMEPIKFE